MSIPYSCPKRHAYSNDPCTFALVQPDCGRPAQFSAPVGVQTAVHCQPGLDYRRSIALGSWLGGLMAILRPTPTYFILLTFIALSGQVLVGVWLMVCTRQA